MKEVFQTCLLLTIAIIVFLFVGYLSIEWEIIPFPVGLVLDAWIGVTIAFSLIKIWVKDKQNENN